MLPIVMHIPSEITTARENHVLIDARKLEPEALQNRIQAIFRENQPNYVAPTLVILPPTDLRSFTVTLERALHGRSFTCRLVSDRSEINGITWMVIQPELDWPRYPTKEAF